MGVLLATGAIPAHPVPGGYAIRAVDEADTEVLGRLYFDAYPAGIAGDTLDEATADIRATFAGAYGELWTAASPLVTYHGTGVGAALTVRLAPWPDVPAVPFVVELFVAAGHRRLGLARALLAEVGAVVGGPVALRVEESNTAARALYASLGFHRP